MNKSKTLLTAIAALALGGSTLVFAAGLGGKADVGVGAGAGTDRGAVGAGVGVDASGNLNVPPPSSGGQINGNGSASADRDTGQDRAADRRSAEGQIHEKASDTIGKRKPKLHKPLPDADDAGSAK